MGVDLLVTYKGKIIADIGRKHLYTFEHFGSIPRSYEEIEEELKTVRKQVLSSIMAFSGSMLNMDFDKEKHVELINEMVIEITNSLECFEEECVMAGRVMTLVELGDEFNEGVEVIDDIELEIKENQKKKDAENKETYLENLRNSFLEDRKKEEDEAAWNRLDEYLAECDKEGIYDAVEHQTSEVDLDFEKDTLTGEKWEDDSCDDLDAHNESIEDIGYCRYCRDLEWEKAMHLEDKAIIERGSK
jgi:hypothetical protein